MKARDLSFDITWRGGAYRVSIPNLNHETVVPLATAEALEAENAKLREAEHPYRDALEKIAASNDGWGCIEIAKRALGR